MAAKSSSVPQGVSATLPNLNLTKKTGIYHVEVWIIFSHPGFGLRCYVVGTFAFTGSPSYFLCRVSQ